MNAQLLYLRDTKKKFEIMMETNKYEYELFHKKTFNNNFFVYMEKKNVFCDIFYCSTNDIQYIFVLT